MKCDKREIKKILRQVDISEFAEMREELLDELDAMVAEDDKEAIKNTQKEVKIDDIADVKADLEDTVADNSIMQTRTENEIEDALLEELDALAAEYYKEAIKNKQKEVKN